jgi:hypothetical protein
MKRKAYVKLVHGKTEDKNMHYVCLTYGTPLMDVQNKLVGYTDKIINMFPKLEDAIKFKNKINFAIE